MITYTYIFKKRKEGLKQTVNKRQINVYFFVFSFINLSHPRYIDTATSEIIWTHKCDYDAMNNWINEYDIIINFFFFLCSMRKQNQEKENMFGYREENICSRGRKIGISHIFMSRILCNISCVDFDHKYLCWVYILIYLFSGCFVVAKEYTQDHQSIRLLVAHTYT